MNKYGDVIIFPGFKKEKRSQRCFLHMFKKTTTLNCIIVKHTKLKGNLFMHGPTCIHIKPAEGLKIREWWQNYQVNLETSNVFGVVFKVFIPQLPSSQ